MNTSRTRHEPYEPQQGIDLECLSGKEDETFEILQKWVNAKLAKETAR